MLVNILIKLESPQRRRQEKKKQKSMRKIVRYYCSWSNNNRNYLVFFVYSNEQAKIRGEAFGKAIEFVQDDLRKTYHSFDSKVSMWIIKIILLKMIF